MELLINTDKYDDQINWKKLLIENSDEILKAVDIEGRKKVSLENIGPGADVFVILVSILTVANVFLLGEKIDKGIEGWIKIGSRIKKLFKKKELVAIDKDGASLLAVEFINKVETIKSLEKEDEHEINLVNLKHMFTDGRKEGELITKPYNYFIQTYIINNEKRYIIGIKSTGEVNLIKCFELVNPYGITEIDTIKNDGINI